MHLIFEKQQFVSRKKIVLQALMNKRTFTTFIVLLLALFTTAQAQVSGSVKYNRISPTELDIVFSLTPQSGWHVYSTGFAAGGPTRAEFGIDSKDGVELAGPLKPGPGEKTINDPIFEMQVKLFEGPCTFTQRVKLTASKYSLQGYLRYGACNDVNCLPPQTLNCKLEGTDGPGATAANVPNAATPAEAQTAKSSDQAAATPASVIESLAALTAAMPDSAQSMVSTADSVLGQTDSAALSSPLSADVIKTWWAPVTDQLKAFGEQSEYADASLFYILLLGFLGGLLALFTPCVWPIIPMTVSFFLKRSNDRSKGIRDAITYGLAIIVIYVTLGLLITLIFGASALNDLSTNAVFNILFFLMLVVFAASFFGGFEITLPSKWSNAVDAKSEQTSGLLSIFLMAFTLALVSFSCTGPIIGFLLVEVSTGGGSILAPAIGMLGFAIALALPFTLFALFPAWLKSAPKSGGWMNTIKVVLGFIELAFALKFLSVADLAYGWHILDRETFLALWIVIFALMGIYLLGWLKFPHDDESRRTSVPRFFMALVSLAFAVYMIPGLWGAPCKAVSAFAPPMSTQDFVLGKSTVEPKFKDYEAGMRYAKQVGKPVMIDFTGFGCVNCRKMEMAVWQDAKVAQLLTDDYVLISLYVDDKTALPQRVSVKETDGTETVLRTVGDKWSYFQRTKFGANAQPFYVLLDNEGKPLSRSYSYDEDIDKYVNFLQQGLESYRN